MRSTLTLLLAIGVIFQSCHKNDDDVNTQNVTVTFGINLPASPGSGRAANINLTNLRITIEDDAGVVVIDHERISIVATTSGFVSDPITLPTGSGYRLTSFFVLDDQDVAIYAAPLEGSPRAELVDDPLPIVFDVQPNEVNNVNVEVLTIEGVDPSEFGFVVFPFTIVETFSFGLAVFERDSVTGQTSLTDASLTISNNQDTLRNVSLGDTINLVEVQANIGSYTLVITKEGFANYEAIFTEAQLQAYAPGNVPLQIVLQYNTSSGAVQFVDSGQSLDGNGASGVEIGDLDNDGDLDAFVAYQNNSNRVWLNDGNGVFTENQSFGATLNTDVALGDLDGDGDLDAFVTTLGTRGGEVWLNDDNGVFERSIQAVGNARGVSVSLGDLDGDNDLDAFVTNQFANSAVWFNDGTGAFTTAFTIQVSNNPSNTTIWDGSLVDLDNDNDLDLVTVGTGTGGKVYLNNGNGTFDNSNPIILTFDAKLVSDANDFNNDGFDDILLLGGNNLSNEIFFSNGNATFNSVSFNTSSQFRNARSADLNGNGSIDFVAVSPTSTESSIVFTNQGDGTFIESQLLLSDQASNDVAIGDLNGDGVLDLFIPGDQFSSVFFGQRQ